MLALLKNRSQKIVTEAVDCHNDTDVSALLPSSGSLKTWDPQRSALTCLSYF